MAYRCDMCGKKTHYGQQVSHSHRVSKRKFKPNLHTVRIPVKGKQKKMRVCTKCLRKLDKMP